MRVTDIAQAVAYIVFMESTATVTRKTGAAKDWACQECGKRMTLKQAERASFGSDGCPRCGGSDIDLTHTEEASRG